MATITPFKERKSKVKQDASLLESCYRYMAEKGCFKRVVVVLVESSHCFCCGESGIESNGTIVLGGHEVQAKTSAVQPLFGSWDINLYFHTENLVDAQQAMEIFTVGNVLLVESDEWSVIDNDFTLYINNLSEISRISGEIGQAISAMIMDNSHES